MEKNAAYFELNSFIHESNLNVMNNALIEAMRNTSIKGFGWSIGLIIETDAYRPKAKDKAIETLIQTDESFDNWTLNSRGDLYILKTLFEDRRDKTAIFIDTRIVRLFEAFARIAALYRYLGCVDDKQVTVQFKYGGLINRTLKVANQNRLMSPVSRVSTTDTFSRVHVSTLGQLVKIEYLEQITIQYARELGQLFDSFSLSEELAKDMLREHSVYRGVQQRFHELGIIQ